MSVSQFRSGVEIIQNIYPRVRLSITLHKYLHPPPPYQPSNKLFPELQPTTETDLIGIKCHKSTQNISYIEKNPKVVWCVSIQH